MNISRWEVENTVRWVILLVSSFWIAQYLRERIETLTNIPTFWLGIGLIIAVLYIYKPVNKLWRIG